MTSIAPVNVWTPALIQMDKDLKEKYGENAHIIPGNGFAPPKTKQPKRPWVLDETLPKIKPPTDIMTEAAKKRAVERAKNKPDEERTFLDYLILAQDKIDEFRKKNPGVIYLA